MQVSEPCFRELDRQLVRHDEGALSQGDFTYKTRHVCSESVVLNSKLYHLQLLAKQNPQV
jgi:hypothetical protein